jgi:rhamnosyltransferase
MRPEDVLAVVVSYDGAPKIRRTVDALRGQVGRILIVDNGSGAETLDVLASLEEEHDVAVVRLGENRGIGHALNRGVQFARESAYGWLLTMDQDSVVEPTLIAAYQAAIRRRPDLVCLAPAIRKNGVVPREGEGEVAYAITSGNLVAVSVFDRIGLYDEGFFIDCIDFDFSLRVRRAGLAVHRVPDAVMDHQLGEEVTSTHLARKYYALHSPTRRYYMYRNYLYMLERYLRSFPAFILKLTISQLLLTVLIGFLDPKPLESYRAIGRGVRDYLARRSGPYVERAR